MQFRPFLIFFFNSSSLYQLLPSFKVIKLVVIDVSFLPLHNKLTQKFLLDGIVLQKEQQQSFPGKVLLLFYGLHLQSKEVKSPVQDRRLRAVDSKCVCGGGGSRGVLYAHGTVCLDLTL